MNTSTVFRKNNVAVITGGADGIGLAAAKALSKLGMKVCLADLNRKKLSEAGSSLKNNALIVETDVGNFNAVLALKEQVMERFGRIDFLFINAGTAAKSGSWEKLENWKKILNTNLWGVINCIHAFAPEMLNQSDPSIIVTTGSKQGITTPPGNPAYNVSKAAVKATAEALQHSLRNYPGSQVVSHLLVPGFTYTGMIDSPAKPDSAWTADQVVDFMFRSIERGDFYILCPDNDVDRTIDNKRISWASGDIIHNRPPLSRWHPDYREAFDLEMNK
ncbi:short-chain dehydrogenase [Microbulbifer sp. A4B17]|uniref:SDR family NAD(P)-dependent oxidoreductase n=1 Tax=Microbulbifer sp. A4B17 TaxID=359370 RepID=UPI000D52CD49|nr:SDR family NAD(P)-dependent oxidoreductase [Microbulbifer sp. A4B17]AWF81962.1 short-chain dehydrogenase [Microbulbifer sp. A4B17]